MKFRHGGRASVNNRENPDLGIEDVFAYKADKIIPAVTVQELLRSFKNDANFTFTMDEGKGGMHRYQHT